VGAGGWRPGVWLIPNRIESATPILSSSGGDNAADRQSDRSFVIYTWLVGLSVATLLISNLASTKMFSLGGSGLVMDGGAVIFPISYVLGDVIVELYGARRARRVIVMTVMMNLLAALVFLVVQAMPPGEGWENQAAFEAILGFAPRIVFASFAAYLLGQFLNTHVFTAIKQTGFGGRNLWWRALGSSLAANLIDSAIFTVIAFAGVITLSQLLALVGLAFVVKMIGETLLLPITYLVCNWLRRISAVV
jgi:uncharacterized integral membrane protein (TIGR00697 family)